MRTAIILEDEAIATRRLMRMLEEQFPEDIEIIGTFEAVSDLAEFLDEHSHPDILFLDIMVADGNSFDLFDTVTVLSKVIFVTAYDEHAIRAFQKNAVHYLLKPLKKKELEEAVTRVIAESRLSDINELKKELHPYKERFLIRFGNKLHSVSAVDISYIYSEDKLSFFIQANGSRVPSDLPLQDIMEDLDPNLFYRANRQLIVHIDSVIKIIRYSRSRLRLELDPPFGQEIVISTENTPKFKEWLDR